MFIEICLVILKAETQLERVLAESQLWEKWLLVNLGLSQLTLPPQALPLLFI